jgi:hypothetical protein
MDKSNRFSAQITGWLNKNLLGEEKIKQTEYDLKSLTREVLARPTTLGSYDAMMAKLKMQLTRPTAKPLLKFSNSVAKTTAQAKGVKAKSRAAILSTVKKVVISTTLPTTENNIFTDADATFTSGSVDEGAWNLF